MCWLLERERGSVAEAAFLDALEAGEMQLVDLTKDDLRRMADLVRRYSNLPLGAVDASVVAVAERLRAHEVATLDLRHFNVVRPGHVESFTLLPS